MTAPILAAAPWEPPPWQRTDLRQFLRSGGRPTDAKEWSGMPALSRGLGVPRSGAGGNGPSPVENGTREPGATLLPSEL